MAAADGTRQKDPYDFEIPAEALIWVVDLGNSKELNYGQVHDIVHRDIAVGNDYRKERIKLLTALATGVFALTVTFHKDLFGSTLTPVGLRLLLLGWLSLVVSLLAGIVHFGKWEDFYLEYRARGMALWHHRTASDDAGKRKARIAFHRSAANIEKLQRSYKKWNYLQSGTLIAGLLLIGAYVAITGDAVVSKTLKTSTAPAATATSAATASPATSPAADPPESKKGGPAKQD